MRQSQRHLRAAGFGHSWVVHDPCAQPQSHRGAVRVPERVAERVAVGIAVAAPYVEPDRIAHEGNLR